MLILAYIIYNYKGYYMKENTEQIVLSEKEINKLNEFLYRLITLKQSFSLILYCLEQKIYKNSKVELISSCYVINNYIETIKSNFSEFLEEYNIQL